MHIGDVLPAPVWAGGWAISLAATGLAIRRFDERRIPRVAVLTSLFFIVSSIPVPVGPTSWHLLLNGLVGIVLGLDAVPAILVALLLQKLLLGDGGFASLGVNTVTMAGGAVAAHLVFRARGLLAKGSWVEPAFGFLAGAAALVVSGLLFYAAMALADPEYRTFSLVNLGLHVPLLLIEPLATASAVGFLSRVKPEMLAPREAVP